MAKDKERLTRVAGARLAAVVRDLNARRVSGSDARGAVEASVAAQAAGATVAEIREAAGLTAAEAAPVLGR